MATFPSRLPYAAFLQYSPTSHAAISKHSKDVTLALKRDGFIRGHRVIDFTARRIREERAGGWSGPNGVLRPGAPEPSAPVREGEARLLPSRRCRSRELASRRERS